jgi:hypothetical protein
VSLTAALATTTAVLAALYALACWRKPFRPCWFCGGLAVRGRRILSRRLRPCRWCRGRGVRLRLGRRAFNRAHHLRDDANTQQPRGTR